MNDWGHDVDNVDKELGRRPFSRGARGALSKDCLSHAALDRLALGEVAPDEATRAQAHLQACRACAEMKALLDRDRASFLIESNLDALAADALARASLAGPLPSDPAQSWWRRLLPPLGLFAAVTAAIIVVPRLREGARPIDGGDGFTSKGAGLQLYVLHTEDGQPAAGATGSVYQGEALHPWDRIQFQVQERPNEHAFVFALDQTDAVATYHPLSIEGHAISPEILRKSGIVSETGAPLRPIAIELDQTLGSETIIALRCPATVSADEAWTAVRRATSKTAAGFSLAAGDLGLPCAQTRTVIKKVPR